MRRETRRKERDNLKRMVYVTGSIIIISIIAFIIGIIAFSNKIENDAEKSEFSTSKISDLVPNAINSENNIEETSLEIGKTVNELKNNISDNSTNNITTTIKNKTEEKAKSENTVEKQEITTMEENNPETIKEENKKVESEIKDPVFIVPVEGEIMREFAKDKLVYSETLGEWITHNGIDIKANKTTIVKASAEGKISSIKNDPRYGLTVSIEHENGFKTIYANLLTAEFVTEGETVESGQTIGTVGNTATFEILDEPHLHFEIIKDNEYLDPSIYIR